MGRSATPDSLDNRPRRQKNFWPLLFPILGIPSGIALVIGASLALYRVRAHACPPGSYVFGSTTAGTLLGILPWVLVGMIAGFALASFILDRLPWRVANQSGGRPKRRRNSRSRRAIGRLAAGLFAAATVLWVYAALVGICAGPDGITYKSFPWSEEMRYQWGDVREAAVICRAGGRYGVSNFYLIMSDDSRFDLAEMIVAAPAHDGYRSVRAAIERNSVRYDDSRLEESCRSALRELRDR